MIATDGSFIQLPSVVALLQYYGGLGQDRTAAAALASLLYDLEHLIIVEAKIVPASENERALAEEHVRTLAKMHRYNRGHRELVIFDKGYPSHELIKSLSDKAIAYVMRVQQGFIRGTG